MPGTALLLPLPALPRPPSTTAVAPEQPCCSKTWRKVEFLHPLQLPASPHCSECSLTSDFLWFPPHQAPSRACPTPRHCHLPSSGFLFLCLDMKSCVEVIGELEVSQHSKDSLRMKLIKTPHSRQHVLANSRPQAEAVAAVGAGHEPGALLPSPAAHGTRDESLHHTQVRAVLLTTHGWVLRSFSPA